MEAQRVRHDLANERAHTQTLQKAIETSVHTPSTDQSKWNIGFIMIIKVSVDFNTL